MVSYFLSKDEKPSYKKEGYLNFSSASQLQESGRSRGSQEAHTKHPVLVSLDLSSSPTSPAPSRCREVERVRYAWVGIPALLYPCLWP